MQAAAPAGLIQIRRQGKFDRGRRVEVTRFAPVEARMGQKNGSAAHGKGHEAQGIDPVRGSDQSFMANTVRLRVHRS